MKSRILTFCLLFAAVSSAPADVLYSFDSPADQGHHLPEVSVSFEVPTLLTATTNIVTGIVSPGVWGDPIESVTLSPGLNNTNPFISIQSDALTETVYYQDNPLESVLGTPVDPQIFDHFGQYVDASGDVLTISEVGDTAAFAAAATAAPEPSTFGVLALLGLVAVVGRKGLAARFAGR